MFDWGILLNILAIIGIVAASSVILFLICKFVMIMTNKNKNNTYYVEEDDLNSLEDQNRLKELEPLEKEEVKSWDESMANKEAEKIAEGDTVSSLVFEDDQNISKMEKDFNAMDEAFDDEEEADYEVSDEELSRLIEKINTESLAEYNAARRIEDGETKEEKVAAPQKVFDLDDEEEDDEESSLESESYEDEKENIERERKELEEAQAQIEAERADLEEQKKQLQEELKRLEELKQEQSTTVVVNDVVSLYSDETLEQLEARLEVLNERLKENKKDLRENKKEYNPLAKVKKTLEKDKAKLTRKEAIVARQKVILYGVNNYVDIDEEKAKKLNEELDLLDGLRLSVQHCEDVMNANKDRFPILEKTNKILKKVNAEILSDIAEVEKAIELKKNKVD